MDLQGKLEQLEAIVLKGGYDEESRQEVQRLRERFEQAVANKAEDFLNHPAVKAYVAYLKTEIARCKEILSEDDTLDEKQRTVYFERKKACQQFLSHFGDSSQLEQTINQLLDAAKSA